MSFPIKLTSSADQFNAVCSRLSLYGAPKCERIQIAKLGTGFEPATAATPDWIERILRFFGFKKQSLRLNEAAQFSLNWLRAHALHYRTEFINQIPQINSLRPLMKKAHLEGDFDALIASAENYAALEEFKKKSEGETLMKTEHIKEELSKRFQFHWPAGFPKAAEIEEDIKVILEKFLTRPGTTLKRIKKTATIQMDVPCEGSSTYTLPVKADFFLEGAITERRIIIKTKEVVGSGGERKVLRAFDLLSGEELVSKPYATSVEKMIVKKAHTDKLSYFPPTVGVREKRFYEKRCQTVTSCYHEPAPVRHALVLQLLSAVKTLHQCWLSGCTYTEKKEDGSIVEKPIDKAPLYHGDIKPANILAYKDSKGDLKAVLSELGTMGNFVSVSYTTFFRSPEKTDFIENKFYLFGVRVPFITSSDIIQHNQLYGRTSDIWSLGVTLTTILSGGLLMPGCPEEFGVPDLDCFRKHYEDLKSGVRKKMPGDIWVLNLTQEEIDASIDTISKRSKTEEYSDTWNLIKRMLKVDPKERYDAST